MDDDKMLAFTVFHLCQILPSLLQKTNILTGSPADSIKMSKVQDSTQKQSTSLSLQRIIALWPNSLIVNHGLIQQAV
jgi:hypothetical protein